MLDNPEFATRAEPAPVGDGVDVAVEAARELRRRGFPRIAEAIVARIVLGEKKYGTRLKSNNGRDALVDLMQELLDSINYSQQLVIEGKDDGWFFEQLISITAAVYSELFKRQA